MLGLEAVGILTQLWEPTKHQAPKLLGNLFVCKGECVHNPCCCFSWDLICTILSLCGKGMQWVEAVAFCLILTWLLILFLTRRSLKPFSPENEIPP